MSPAASRCPRLERTRTIQTLGARFAQGRISLEEAAELGCRACASPGGGCQFLGTAATSQVVAEALGLSLPHSALAPSGQPVWLDMARRSARALVALAEGKRTVRDILTPASFRNAMALHAAFGGSTNLLLHVPAIAHAAGLPPPSVEDWISVNRRVPRLVSVLPNGPLPHPTVRVFLAGGVPDLDLQPLLREVPLRGGDIHRDEREVRLRPEPCDERQLLGGLGRREARAPAGQDDRLVPLRARGERAAQPELRPQAGLDLAS
jgi:dihydroxyacid dehydratase/phosphogluconate dehydratase